MTTAVSELDVTPLRILALTTHPIESPGPRYRVIQYIPKLEQHGFCVDLQSFTPSTEYADLFNDGERLKKARWLLANTARRALTLARARRYDVILVQVWVHPMTFPPFDLALRASGVPIVYDIDDAYYLPSGSIGDRLRDKEWLVRLMRMSHSVIAGSKFIRDFVVQHNPRVEILPTAVDTERFVPRDVDALPNPRPVIGWIGTHTTFPYLAPLLPVFQELAREHDFVLRIVGSGKDVYLPGVRVENISWTLEKEVDYFRNLDIGLYPLVEGIQARAKHGFKLQQYMACGVPAVVSAIGQNPELVRHGETAFLAQRPEEWHNALSLLIRDGELRRRVGGAARALLDQKVSLNASTPAMVRILRAAAASKVTRRVTSASDLTL